VHTLKTNLTDLIIANHQHVG